MSYPKVTISNNMVLFSGLREIVVLGLVLLAASKDIGKWQFLIFRILSSEISLIRNEVRRYFEIKQPDLIVLNYK